MRVISKTDKEMRKEENIVDCQNVSINNVHYMKSRGNDKESSFIIWIL